jgi:hypothetical protein
MKRKSNPFGFLEIVKLKPKTKNELLGIKGIGQKKADWFGDELIEILENYL